MKNLEEELKQLRAEKEEQYKVLTHLRDGALSDLDYFKNKLIQSQAENAVLVEALNSACRNAEAHKRAGIGIGPFDSWIRALANTSEQAKALLEVVEAATSLNDEQIQNKECPTYYETVLSEKLTAYKG